MLSSLDLRTCKDTMTDSSSIPVFDLQNLIDPYPMYKQLRDEAPVYHVPELNMYYVTSYELLRQVIRDTKTYSSQYDDFMAFSRDAGLANLPDGIKESISQKMREMIPTPPTMLTLDEPDHTKYRSLVSQLFTAGEIRKSEADVQAVIDRHANAFTVSDGEFMRGFAFPVPLEIISVRLGIPEEDREFFYDAATCAAAGLRIQQLDDEEMLRRAQVAVDLQNLLVVLAAWRGAALVRCRSSRTAGRHGAMPPENISPAGNPNAIESRIPGSRSRRTRRNTPDTLVHRPHTT